MKKTLTVVLITLICLVAFASCQKNCEHIKGEWKYDEAGHWQPITCSLNTCDLEETPIYDHIYEDTEGVCDICGYLKPEDNLNDNSNNNSNDNSNNDTDNNIDDTNNNTDDNSNDTSNTTENDGDGTTENGGNGTTENGGNDTADVVDDGMVRTVLNGGGQGAPSLPHYVSTEVAKRCLVSNGAVLANVYLGHATFRNSVAFSDFVLDMSELQNCSFSIIANYNGEKSAVLMENVNYSDELYKITITDLYDENEVYKGSVVNYSNYHRVELDIASMVGVPYGYVNIELQIQLSDGTKSVVVSDTIYYSVTETEIVFGLVSNPIAHEGDKGVITNGWVYQGA